jgi:hypothetical protein
VVCGLGAGLVDPRVKADVADQMARGRKPADIADRGEHRAGGIDVHARDAHQPLDLRGLQRLTGDLLIQQRDLLVDEVDLTQTSLERLALVDGQLSLRQSRSAALAEHVAEREDGLAGYASTRHAPRSSGECEHAPGSRDGCNGGAGYA